MRQPVDDDELAHRRVARDQRRLQRDELRGVHQGRQARRRRHRSGGPAEVHRQLARREAPDPEEVRQRLVEGLVTGAEAVGIGCEDPVPLLRQLREVRLDVRFDLGTQVFRDEEAQVLGVQAVDRRDAGRGVADEGDQQGLCGGFRRHAPDYSTAQRGQATSFGHPERSEGSHGVLSPAAPGSCPFLCRGALLCALQRADRDPPLPSPRLGPARRHPSASGGIGVTRLLRKTAIRVELED